eukprot:2008392-Ditylum_brightwellii.AAC.1
MSAFEEEVVLKESTTSTFNREVSENEEINTPARQFCGQPIILIIADDIDTYSTSDMEPMLSTEN